MAKLTTAEAAITARVTAIAMGPEIRKITQFEETVERGKTEVDREPLAA